MTRIQPLTVARLHCLDWLRVSAIGVLIIYHIGMVYVPNWGYHFKNPLKSQLIQSLMLLTSPWRMGLLWFISGVAFAYMCRSNNKGLINVAIKRTNQILLPLLVGILFVVPSQLFAQMKQAGDMPLNFPSFIYAFYIEPKDYFAQYTAGIWPHFDVNHLWFLRSLWKFSIVLLILTPILHSARFKTCMTLVSANIVGLLAIVAIPIALVGVFLQGELVRESYGLILLTLGYCLGMHHEFWQTLSKHLRLLCASSIIVILALQFGFVSIWQNGSHLSNSELKLLMEGVYTANKILPLLAILALAHRYLNTPNQHISQLSAYVFPLYIVHQSVIIFVAYLATNSRVAFIHVAESQIWLNLLATPLICATLVYVIARFNILRMCFGMRLKNNIDPYQNKLVSAMVLVLCLPLIIRLM